MNTRLYLVSTKGKTQAEDTVLVEAVTGAQALRFVANQTFETRIATATETANYMKQGAKWYSAVAAEGETNGTETNTATV